MNIFQLAVSIFMTYGREAAKRAITPPEEWVRHVAQQTGADPDEAVAKRNDAVEAEMEFIEALVTQHQHGSLPSV